MTIKNRIEKLENHIPANQLVTSDNFWAWFNLLPKAQQDEMRETSRALLRAWELETFGEEITKSESTPEI